MENPILKSILIFIIYLMDGAMIIGGMEMLVTRFFGHRAKQKKSRRLVFIIALVVYVLINFLIFSIVEVKRNGNTEILMVSELAYIFAVVYWLISMEEKKKWHKVVCAFAAMAMLDLINSLGNHAMTMFLFDNTNMLKALLILIFSKAIVFGIVGGLSYLSSRKRKEPMRLSLMVIAYIVFTLVQLIDTSFYQPEDDVIKSVVSMDLILSDELINAAKGYTFVFVLVLFMGIIIFLLIKESEAQYFQKKNTISEYYLETQKQHYETLTESNREIRKIKHDMKNHIYCLQGLYECGKYEELGKYLGEMDESLKQVAVTNYVGHEIADAIISEKKHKAEELGILLNAEGALFGVEFAAIDVCTIFSNILDNAIEATQKLPADKRQIDLKVGRNKNYLFISECNPVEHAPAISDNAIATTKKNSANHGFGITNIKEAAAKYDGDVQLFVEEDKSQDAQKNSGAMFHIEVMIPVQE